MGGNQGPSWALIGRRGFALPCSVQHGAGAVIDGLAGAEEFCACALGGRRCWRFGVFSLIRLVVSSIFFFLHCAGGKNIVMILSFRGNSQHYFCFKKTPR